MEKLLKKVKSMSEKYEKLIDTKNKQNEKSNHHHHSNACVERMLCTAAEES